MFFMKSLEWNAIKIFQDTCTCRCCTVKKNREEKTASNMIRRVMNLAVLVVADISEFKNDIVMNNMYATVGWLGGLVGLHENTEQKLL